MDSMGKMDYLQKVLKARVEMEHLRRAYFASLLKARKMDNNFDVVKERECFSCYYDLHLSAVGHECCPKKFACLEHTKQHYACSWNKRFQPGATSPCVYSHKYKNHELAMVGEATHSHASTLDTMLKQNAKGMVVSSFEQHEEMKLTSCASQLVGQMNDLTKSVCKIDIPLSDSVLENSQVSFLGMIGSFEEA
eukprot:Gb_22405 [translate_table: standard]